MEQQEHHRLLVQRYLDKQATPEELEVFAQLMREGKLVGLLTEAMNRDAELTEADELLFTPVAKIRRLWPKIAVAASVLVVLGAGAYLFKNRRTVNTVHDIAPYSAQAILKTGGKTILLDSTKNGSITQKIIKSTSEQLTYAASEETAVYDTIQIPAGGRPYEVKLSDGSKITLNAATTLRYPESFSKDRRENIELISGEIYAEIVHNPNAPLQIKAPGQLISDIGTVFNISAYPDEESKTTTLVSGKIAVNNTKLQPGEQTILIANNLTVAPANIEQTTAWKNGYFRFNGEHIDVIMRQLARWYNIEVIYEGKKTTEVFYGKVTRKRNISEVLKMLEKTQKIRFKVEGRRVTVLSKS